VKCIDLNINQRVIDTRLKDDSVSTLIFFKTLGTVQLILVPVKDTKLPSAQPLAILRLLGREM
jgi:hypothetical protein